MLRLSSNLKQMKYLKFFLILLGFVFVATPVKAQELYNGQISNDERILEFRSDIKVNSDTTINIVEKITYRPSIDVPRHGLEWTIPYEYSVKAFRRPTKLTINRVSYYPLNNSTDVISNQYSRIDENGWVTLRIGDADRYIQGTYVYVIDYTMKYTGISYFDTHDEVYLNIIGPGWKIPIENASATLTLPAKVEEVVCFTGPDGSTVSDCTFQISKNVIDIKPNSTLNSFEGYTIAIKQPKGTFEDTTKEQIILSVLANIGIILPIPVGIYLFGFLKKKYKNEKLTIIPYYEPEDGMNSLSAGTIINVNYKPKHISAIIIELAIKGYYKIREIENKKYELIKSGKDINDLPTYLQTLLSKIFTSSDTVRLEKLTNFYETSTSVYTSCKEELFEKNIFLKSADKLKPVLIVFSFFGIFLLIFFNSYFQQNALTGWLIGIIISLILVIIFSLGIDIKTKYGNEIYHKLLGLKLYINTAEKNRIEFHDDPKKYRGVFESLLPYAMIFGLEKKWAKEFEDIYTTNPDWYDGNFTTFNSYYLLNSLSSFNRSVNSRSTPPSNYSNGSYRSGGWSSGGSGFGGGGSSGGGGGGSGGGGW